MISIISQIKRKLIDWALEDGDRVVFEKLFLDKPEHVLSVEKVPYSCMLVRFVDGREVDIPSLSESFMDQLVGFERDLSARMPTWVNIFSVVAVNAAIETRALRALAEVADRLGYELREKPLDFMARLEELRRETPEVTFVGDDDPKD